MTLTLYNVLYVFSKYLKGAGYTKQSIDTRLTETISFYEYVHDEYKVTDFRDVTMHHIEDYLSYLKNTISKRTTKPYTINTIRAKVSAVKLLFKCLYVEELMLINPAQDVKNVSKDIKSKREVLTEQEVALFLDSIDINDPLGLRDRTMYELMYSSGLRCSEVSRLNIGDIDVENRLLLLRKSKGRKDRVVPITQAAIRFLIKHMGKRKAKDEPVFTGNNGRISANAVGHRFRDLLKRFGLYRPRVSAHSIRHSTATHMLEHGAGVRFVQELLGHESIETTVLYTHVLLENLKRVYRSYHPRENEYYKEIDAEYEKRLSELLCYIKKARLTKRKYRKVVYKDGEEL